MRYLSDGMHWTLPTMLLGFGGLLVLVPLGYALTFGLSGLPELGAGGLGVASAVMMWAQALAFAAYLARARRFYERHGYRAIEFTDSATCACSHASSARAPGRSWRCCAPACRSG